MYIIAKQDNDPVFAADKAGLAAALDKFNMSRGRFVHIGGQPCESAALYKGNGWLAGCVYFIHDDPLAHGKAVSA